MYHLLCKLGIEYDDIGCNYKIIFVGCIEKSQFLFHLTFNFKVGAYSLLFSQIELSIEQFDILGLRGILNEVIVQEKKKRCNLTKKNEIIQ